MPEPEPVDLTIPPAGQSLSAMTSNSNTSDSATFPEARRLQIITRVSDNSNRSPRSREKKKTWNQNFTTVPKYTILTTFSKRASQLLHREYSCGHDPPTFSSQEISQTDLRVWTFFPKADNMAKPQHHLHHLHLSPALPYRYGYQIHTHTSHAATMP